MIVGVLTTCHTQYTWDRSICIFFLFNRTTLQVFVTYLIGPLHTHPLWFYKHQHDNRVRSELSVACQRWRFQWRFWFVPSVPEYLREEGEHKTFPGVKCNRGVLLTTHPLLVPQSWKSRATFSKSPPPQHVHMTHHRREHRPSVSRSPNCGSCVNDERLRCLN